MSIIELASKGDVKGMKFLLDLSLGEAAKNGKLKVVDFLLKLGANPNKSPALPRAAFHNHLKVVKRIAPISDKSRLRFAMNDAVRKGHTRIAKYLLQHVEIDGMLCVEAKDHPKIEKLFRKHCQEQLRSRSRSRSKSRVKNKLYKLLSA